MDILDEMIYGIGVDIIEVERIQSLAEKNPRFLTRIFTETEITYCTKMKNKYQHLAARFAAKEAFVKAVGLGMSGGMRWRDIGIVNDTLGRPELVIEGRAAERLEELEVRSTHVSLTHTGEHAAAVVILEK